MVAETLDDLFSDDSMPKTAVDEELFELCTEFENVFHQCIPREMMPLWVTDEKLKEAIRNCLQQKNADILGVLGIEISEDSIY